MLAAFGNVVLASLFFTLVLQAVPVVWRGIFAGMRWVVRRYGRRPSCTWFAREGIVEDIPDKGARIIIPWGQVSAFDLSTVELHHSVVRVWLARPDEKSSYVVFGPASTDVLYERMLYASTTRERHGADLVLRSGLGGMREEPGAAYHLLRRIARDPDAVNALPTAIDGAPPVDLKGLGVL